VVGWERLVSSTLAEALKDRTAMISFGGYADQWLGVTRAGAGVDNA